MNSNKKGKMFKKRTIAIIGIILPIVALVVYYLVQRHYNLIINNPETPFNDTVPGTRGIYLA
jgi:hypothetical protein